MAKRRKPSVPGGIPSSTNRFDKSLNTDVHDFHLDKQSWTNARNAINNTHIGDKYSIGNEPGNEFCSSAPYSIIGAIHMTETRWWIFSTNDADGHEIGEFDEGKCTYETIVNDPCLNFSTKHPISGSSRSTWDCSYRVYWQDNLNPDRTLDRNDVPWIEDCVDSNGEEPGGCVECTPTDDLDCDKLRLEAFMSPPCPKLSKGPAGGTILNGSYYVHIAYMVDSQVVTDYFPMSNVVHIFDHDQPNSSLDLEVLDLDTDNFDQYQVVIVQQIANKLSVRQLGIFSTNQDKITIDIIDATWPAINPDLLPVTNPIADRSEGIFDVGKYLFRTGLTTKLDFNYQPLANQIRTKWQLVEYPEDYYKDGGTNVGYMRDEVYAFFIRFRYRTGDISNSYHIPGRAARLYQIPGTATQLLESDDYLTVEDNNIEQQQGLTSRVFEMFNTASGTNVSVPQDDGGLLVGEGDMGYWESENFYPDQTPQVWNTNDPAHPEWDLCGTPIRHHKFPENSLYEGFSAPNTLTNHYVNNDKKIRVMGVAFENILPPVDNDGNPIPNIIGYEILRGSRSGNKTVLYKGLINNMRRYNIDEVLGVDRLGLYPNYPFNSVLYADAFNSTTEVTYEPQTGTYYPQLLNRYVGYNPIAAYSQKHFTFHCPDTMFNKPFLGQKELKIYGAAYGKANAIYKEVDNHPKHVFLTDLTFWVGIIIGIGYAIGKKSGTVTKTYRKPTLYMYDMLEGGSGLGPYTYTNSTNNLTAFTTASQIAGDVDTGEDTRNSALDFIDAITGIGAGEDAQDFAEQSTHLSNSSQGSGITTGGGTITYKDKSSIPKILQVFQAAYMFAADMAEGADLIMDIISKLSGERQFALQYQGYSGYENFAGAYTPNRRRIIDEANYLKGHLQNFRGTHRVNNVLRFNTVMFDTTRDVADLVGPLADTTMNSILVSQLGPNNYDKTFTRRASSHYVAFKSRLRNQYGDVYNVQQVPASNCVLPLEDENRTGVIFGGDTYIGRYQEKNTFYHFYRWLLNQPDRAELDYHLYDAVQHSAFWMNSEPYNTMQFFSSLPGAIQNMLTSGSFSTFFQSLETPSDKTCFNRLYSSTDAVNSGTFTMRNAFFYLFHSSVRDFFVESELNIDMRDWEDDLEKQHWAVLQDLEQMFHSSRIKAGNYYKLDRGLSVHNLPFSKISWGKMQDREYDPELAETCYRYLDKRLAYSLPQQTLLKRDNWRAFLANNYKDFNSTVTAIKSVGATGIMLLFRNQAPGVYPGVDELQLKSGTSVTVGDGGLFAREMQRFSNADKELEYGSCQSRRSAKNTPFGAFFISQNQGKIFKANKGLQELTVKNNLYWFNQYLPYQILEYFPDYDLLDNPIGGVGCQTIYDNEWGIIYFCKIDYAPKPEWRDRMVYDVDQQVFIVDEITRVDVNDLRFFDNASWTVSFDADMGEYISHHDWHPNLGMSGKNTFLTVKDDEIWRHNNRCDLYCNFYGEDFPFEIEFQIDTTPAVVTIRNVEYHLQVFEFSDNCRDRFHILDDNFDEAVIHNTEQVSGLLRLNLEPKNDVRQLMTYPIVGLNQIDILYSKEEQRTRFNQFWDITNDRGEYSPTANETIWLTEPNGYIRNLNPLNMNYNKGEFQRKKFRHHTHRVLLRRSVSGRRKMILLLTNTKIQNSPR